MSFAAMMLLALLFDALMGWPDRLYARVGHPVTWLGWLISKLEARLNHGGTWLRRSLGAATVGIVLAASVTPAVLIQALLPPGCTELVLGAILAWPLIAARSLYEHVAAVARPLSAGDLADARAAVAMIVGRDPSQLEMEGVARAALESLSENASDGIVAPLFWGAVGGLPGIVAYKAINTMDSMIGHRNARYEDFGKVAARLDDLVNLLPARLTGLALVLGSGRREALRVMCRDAATHRSPNAGWPEAAMAGALGVRLSGPRVYGERVAQEPWLNAGARDPGAVDLVGALVLYIRAMVICAAALAVIAVGEI